MSGPIATRHSDRSVTVEWPEGKPESFEISTVLFEQMMAEHAAERALADDLADALDSGSPIVRERALARYREARSR